jgi:5-formyltetrahydrofolate cyclo-ligase
MTQPSLLSRATLRKNLLALRRNTAPTMRHQWDSAIADNLLRWCSQYRPASLGLFWPIQAEPDLREIYPELQKMGIQLALPLVQAKQQPLLFLEWQSGDAMDTDEYGIPVPQQRERSLIPQVVLIPCVGYNRDKFRMGYGGGYYDRTLAKQPRPLALGIAYAQAQADFAAETHDIAMDEILTENGKLKRELLKTL